MNSTERYRFGLIGYPIGHSQSPALFKKECGGRWEYDLLEFDNFEDSLKAFADGPYKAVNVTAPYKTLAAERADIRSAAVERIGAANILVKTPEGIAAYNSDFLAVRELLEKAGAKSVTVIGLGGAGRAALAAAEGLGLPVRGLHHNEISEGVADDTIIYTLPSAVPGCDRLDCRVIIEANYKDPCLMGHNGYISGFEWLHAQAVLGFGILTGQSGE
ncbi:MAG: hypothetical protein Q4F39_03030 [Bacteroidia bacterium]|nr:hypothetical protein [Bacteroidia bacterium]